MVVNDPDQTAADEQRQRILHGAARQAGGDRDATVAGAGAPPLRSPRFRPKMQINEKCCGSAIMSGEISHEHIHHVMIEAQISPHAHILL